MHRKLVISPLFADPDPLRQPWRPGQPLPTLIKLLRFGVNPSVKGAFRVTEETLANLSAEQAKRGRDHVVIDFEHNTVPGAPAYEKSQEPRPVAARKARVIVTEDKCIALSAPEWTQDGQVKAEHYADFSPAIVHDEDTLEVVALHSAGLVRNGAVEGLTFCSADGGSVQDQNQEDETMKELLAALIAAKLLPAGADEAAAVKLVTELLGRTAGLQEKVDALTADKIKALTAEAVRAEIAALGLVKDGKPVTPELIALSADVAAIKAARTADAKARIADRAKSEGKVILLAAEAISALSVEQLEDHVSKLPVTVPLDQRTRVTPAGADGAGGKPYTEDQAAVARSCGNDPEKVYKKA